MITMVGWLVPKNKHQEIAMRPLLSSSRTARVVALSTGLLALALLASTRAEVQSKPEQVLGDLGVITSINFWDQNNLIVTKRYGALHLINVAMGKPASVHPLFNFPLFDPRNPPKGEYATIYDHNDGLMSAVLIDRQFLFTYGAFYKDGTTKNRVFRFNVRDNGAGSPPNLENRVLVVDNLPYNCDHAGGALAKFGDFLYLATGDEIQHAAGLCEHSQNGDFTNAQNKDSIAGKLLRIRLSDLLRIASDDGAINALVSSSVELRACGLRDSQAMTPVLLQGNWYLAAVDHGPSPHMDYENPGDKRPEEHRGHDELNLISLGPRMNRLQNFGWPYRAGQETTTVKVTHSSCGETYDSPRYVWPDMGKSVAPAGIAADPKTNDIFVGMLMGEALYRVRLGATPEKDEVQKLTPSDWHKRIRAVGVSPGKDRKDRPIYFVTSQGDATALDCGPNFQKCTHDYLYRLQQPN